MEIAFHKAYTWVVILTGLAVIAGVLWANVGLRRELTRMSRTHERIADVLDVLAGGVMDGEDYSSMKLRVMDGGLVEIAPGIYSVQSGEKILVGMNR